MKLPFAQAWIVASAVAWVSCSGRKAAPPESASASGARIYREQCVRCHGPMGEGVAGRHDETLHGEKSVESLARLIARTMPEDRDPKLPPDQARSVAEYIHGAFYSAEARARNNPAKVDFVRLTNRQYRESVADLVAGLREHRQASRTGGLSAEYHASEGMNRKKAKVLDRIDPVIAFDFGEGAPEKGMPSDQFSVTWTGSLVAPGTGPYGFRLTTPNGARLQFNTDLAAGEAGGRDEGDPRRQAPLIDLWVGSSGPARVGEAEVFLLGGRAYPLRLEFFKFKEKTSSVRLEWKPPHGVWQVVPAEALSPERSSMTTVVATSFPADDSSVGYERGTSVSKAWHEATTKASVEVAGSVVSRLGVLTGTDSRSSNRVEKLREFCATFATRAFRRPLTPELRAAFVDAAFADGLAPEIAVRRSLLRVLNSPRFLYPDATGAEDDAAVATRLALTLWDSLPDRDLREAAERGELRTPEQVRTQAARMLGDPRTRTKVAEFFRHWLPIEKGDDLGKDRKAFPDFDEAVAADLRTSLEKFVDRVVWSGNSDYRELLKADYLLLNGRLARFYGVAGPTGEGFEPVAFEAGQRVGLFTHPYILASLSYHRSTSPIHRGVFLTRNVFGRFLKPPPMAIEFMDDRFDPSLTMREKVTELTSKPNCMGCHATINPLGFSLEGYDAVGRVRSTDNGKPVDPVSEYVGADGKEVRLRGPRDLADLAERSPEARRGFVRHLFQQMAKQPPAAYGSDTLERLDRTFVQGDHSIRKLVLEVAVTSAVREPATRVASNP